MDEYEAVARFADGREIRANGNINQVANWADNVIRGNGSEVCVMIEKKGEKANEH